MDNQQERLIADANWLAGVWESEGSFTLSKQNVAGRNRVRYRAICSVVNTDPDFMNAVINILKKNYLAFYTHKRTPKGKRTRVDLNIYGIKRVNRFLEFIMPYLRSKIARAKMLKHFIDYRLSVDIHTHYGVYEETLYKRMKELNNKGNCY